MKNVSVSLFIRCSFVAARGRATSNAKRIGTIQFTKEVCNSSVSFISREVEMLGSQGYTKTLSRCRKPTVRSEPSSARQRLPPHNRNGLLIGPAPLHAAGPHELGGSYTTGIVLVTENTPIPRCGGAVGFLLAGHSLGLTLALVLTGAAIPIGGYPLAFVVIALGPTIGGVAACVALRRRRIGSFRVTGSGGDRRGAPEPSRPADDRGIHLPLRARATRRAPRRPATPGYREEHAAGPGAVGKLRATGERERLRDLEAPRWGRTPIIFAMASLSALCSFAFGWLLGVALGRPVGSRA